MKITDSNGEIRRARITVESFEELVQDGSGFLKVYEFVTEEIKFGWARIRLPYKEIHVRAGGTIAGPAMMALADFTSFAALMGAIGPARMAVTSSLSINFLRRPAPTDIVGEAQIVEVTSRLGFAEVELFTLGEDLPIAHISSTYAIPRILPEN
tara:strand:+ start:1098 stop:1559 length:462 start_codon:yes stop_codon:yes gene_type:complete